MITEKQGATMRVYFDTIDIASGAPTDAAATPTVTVYKDGVSIGAAGATVTNKATGLYELAIVCSVGNGYDIGSRFNAVVSATVAGVAGVHCVADFAVTLADVDDVLNEISVTHDDLLTTTTVVNLIETYTDSIEGRLPAALVGGRMDVTVGAMQNSVITAAAIATDAIDADALAATALAEIAAAVWAQVLESGYTAADMFRGAVSVLFGKVADFTTGNLVFRNLADTKNRITVATGSTGRTSSTINDLT